ncbi:hypothetical protein PybrP1_012200 [[Pythium] brassicae (nom. inval.)]|nr:hypothetical protein PybrP1_012200 [[Pythium] brassicae (nom. inval.)]
MERDSQEIRLCALVLSVVAFFLFIAAEAAHEARRVASRGVLLLVASGALAFAWIGPLTLLAGTLRARSFQWWQPFRGGADFVWMQAYGWCLHTFVLSGAVVVLANPQVPKWFEGQYLLLGAMGFMAQLLLNLSIGCFREPPPGGAAPPAFRFPLNTKAVGSLLVSASATLMFVCYDLFSQRGRSTVMIALGCVEFTVSALVIHVLYGCAEVPGFRVWQPFEGERTFLLLQYLGWQLFALTIGGALGIFFRAGDDSIYGTSKGTATAVGAMGMTSQVLLLTSLQYFDKRSAQATTTESESRTASARSVKRQLATTGRQPAEVYVAGLLCAGAIGVGCVSYAARFYADALPAQLVRFCIGHETVGWIISLSSLALAAPVANMGGVRSRRTYRWWQPFQGGTKFVFLQTIGWLWYGFYLALALVLCMNSSYFGQVAGCVVLFVGAGSAGAIATSLHYFEPLKRPRMAGADGPQRRGQWVDEVRGEVAMVALLALSSMLLRVLLDYLQARLQASIRALGLVLAMTLFVLAATVSQFAGRKLHRHFRLWQPFEGGDRFVVRQAVGWAVFGVQLLFDSLLLTLTATTIPFGALSLLGVFALVPQYLILSSIQYFQSPDATAAAAAGCRGDAGSRSWAALLCDASLKWHVWASVLVVASSACLFICAEVLGVRGSSFLRAEEVLYAFGSLLSLFGIGFTHCVVGPRAYSSYRVFQPFRGGIEFTTFHGAAWTLVAIAWAFSMTVIYWSALFFTIPGIHLTTGMLFTAPQTLLLVAIPLFKPAEETRCGARRAATHGAPSRHALNCRADDLANQYFVGRLLGFSACAVFVLLDLAMVRWGPAIPAFPMSVSAVLALFSSIPMSYKFATSHHRRTAKSISGGIVFVVLGCALWSFTLLLGALFSYNLWRVQDIGRSVSGPGEPTKYMGSVTGSVGLAAQLLLFQASPSSRGKTKHALTPTRDDGLLLNLASLKSYATLGPFWVLSSVPLVAGLVYAHTKSTIPKHLATPQALVLMLCSCAVIWSAWWIRQQIFSTDAVYLLSSSGAAKVLPLSSASVMKAPVDHIPALDIGFDCYLQIAAFLTVAELIQFSAASKGLSNVHSESFWRRVFVERFDPSARAIGPQELPSLRRSSLPSAASIGTHPFAATVLNRVEGAVLSWICRLQKAPSSYTSGKQISVHIRNKWRTFCLGGERQFSFEQCKVCSEIDAVNTSLVRWEHRQRCQVRTPSTWVTVCACVNPVTLRVEKAHRACLEKRMAERARQPRDGRQDASLSAFEICSDCDSGPTTSDRLPRSMRELLQVTWGDFQRSGGDFGGGFFVVMPASSSVFIMAIKAAGWGSCTLYLWVVSVVALCFIINSPRFVRCLERLGRPDSPSFVAYQRAYHALAMSSILHLAWCCPTMNRFEAAPSPSLVQIAVKVAFRVNGCLFAVLSATALLAFWRTQYRLPTVSGAKASAAATVDPPDAEDESCVLCLLKLCDDTRE